MNKEIPTFYSVDDIRREYIRTSSGHWFDDDTMRFFKTRLTNHFKQLNKKTYAFISTEKGPGGIRMASIRIVKIRYSTKHFYCFKVEIDTYGKFHSFTLPQAIRHLKTLTLKDVNNA